MATSNPYDPAGVLTGQWGVGSNTPYGYIPRVPNLADTAAQSISGSLQNLGSLSQLLSGASAATTSAAQIPYISANPYWANTMAQLGSNAYDLSQGLIPQGDLNDLINNAVSNKYASGITSSPNLRSAVIQQVLGGKMKAQQQGLANMQALAAITPQGKQLDPASFIPSAADYQNWSYLANQLAAAPDPTLARQAELAASLSGMNLGANRASRGPYGSPYGNPYGFQGTTRSYDPTPTSTAPKKPYAPPGGGSGVWMGYDGSTWHWDNGAGMWRNVTTGEYSTDDNLPASSEQMGGREEDWWRDYVGGSAPFEAQDYYSEGGYTYDQSGYNYDPYADWAGYNVEAPDYGAALNYNLYGDYYRGQ